MMEKVRIIHAAHKNIESNFDEKIIITQEGGPASDYFTDDYDIISDTMHDMNMPLGFPMDYTFKRELI
jgi:hypothetical protein